ncbi:hypothetical protein BH20ACT6_BH20ACT6_18620 [soil metagenome]
MQVWVSVLTGLLIVIGLVGVVVPVLPGLLLVWAAVAVWVVVEADTPAYILLGAATAMAVAAGVLKYVIPGRRLRRAGVPERTLMYGALAAVVGFFVIPVIGVVVGFVAGVYVAERQRLADRAAARASTGHALRAAGLSILVELTAALLIAAGWLGVLAVA